MDCARQTATYQEKWSCKCKSDQRLKRNQLCKQVVLTSAHSLKEESGCQRGCSPRQLQADAGSEQQDCLLPFSLRCLSPNRLHQCQWEQPQRDHERVDSGEWKRLHAPVQRRQQSFHRRRNQWLRRRSTWISHPPDWQH